MNTLSIFPDVIKTRYNAFSTMQLKPFTQEKVAEPEQNQFASAIVHEIRNPLTNINLAADLLQSTLIADDQKIYLDIIVRASTRINDLANNLLAHYKPDETQFEKYFVHQLIEDVLAITSDRINLKNITVKKHFITPDAEIFVNKREMKIAMTNILINAIDAMPAANRELKLVTKSINNKHFIEIADNGIGISKENLKKIFNPYFTDKPGGIGLGLSTTLNILLSNHIGIDVQSVEGAGTSFILSFNKIP